MVVSYLSFHLVPLRKSPQPDGNIPVSGQNSDINTDRVDDINDSDNDVGKASAGINEDDENSFDADGNFDADDFSGFEDLSLSGGRSDYSEADIDDYAHSEEEEVKQLVKIMKDSSNVCRLRTVYNKDGLESQTYDGDLLPISHDEMAHCVGNGAQEIYDDAMARKQASVSIKETVRDGGRSLDDEPYIPAVEYQTRKQASVSVSMVLFLGGL